MTNPGKDTFSDRKRPPKEEGDSNPLNHLPKKIQKHVSNGFIELKTPFSEKEDAKLLGAKFDPTTKKWRIPVDQDWRRCRDGLSAGCPLMVSIADPPAPPTRLDR